MKSKLIKRPFSLMEVMIAFALILFCLIPLIYPNLAMYRDQSQFTEKIKADYAVTLLYGDLIERLHRREIPFEQLIQKQPSVISIPPETLLNAGIDSKFPYKVTLTAKQTIMKGEKSGSYIAAIVEFVYLFEKGNEKKESLRFVYQLPIVKLKPDSAQEPDEEPEKPSPPRGASPQVGEQ